jgi:hypothetical protein
MDQLIHQNAVRHTENNNYQQAVLHLSCTWSILQTLGNVTHSACAVGYYELASLLYSIVKEK